MKTRIVEKSMLEALKDYANGLEVIVMGELVDGGIMSERLEHFFLDDTRFLVKVPVEPAAAITNELPSEEVVQEEAQEQDPVPEEKPKSKKQIVRELMEQGLSNKEIIKQTGFNDNTVYQVRYELKKEKGEYPTRA